MFGISSRLVFAFDRLRRVGPVLEFEWIAIDDRVIGEPESGGGGGNEHESHQTALSSSCGDGLLQIRFADFFTSRNRGEKWGTFGFVPRPFSFNRRRGISVYEYTYENDCYDHGSEKPSV